MYDINQRNPPPWNMTKYAIASVKYELFDTRDAYEYAQVCNFFV